MNIYEKLSAVQNELKAPKSQYNSFGKYKYRNCEDILEAAKPLLQKNKASVYVTDSIEYIGDRYYIKAIAVFIDCEKPEQQPITVTAYAREEENKKGMDGSQVTGASSSYARKYALNGLFLIDDTKDSDSTNNGQSITNDSTPTRNTNPKNKDTSNQEKPSGISAQTRKEINGKILEYKKATGIEVKAILATVQDNLGFAVDSINTEEQAKRVLKLLDNMIMQSNGKGA